MKNLLKTLLKQMGLRLDALLIPYYWIPYNFMNGRAFNPLRITMELTWRCNLKCKMCPLELDKARNHSKPAHLEELTTRELKDFIAELERLKLKSILLTGGEPFLRKDIDELICYIKERNFYCAVLSNGYAISEQSIHNLVNCGLDLISFSLDGPREVHNRIRGIPDSFDRIARTVALIKEVQQQLNKKTPRIILNCTISALNQDSFSQVVEAAREWGIKLVDYMYLFYTTPQAIEETRKALPVGELKPEDQIIPENIKNIDPEIMRAELNQALEKGRLYGIEVGFNPPLKPEELKSRYLEEKFAFSNKCFYPWYETRLDPYGNIYPCSLDVAIGNIRKESFATLWNSKNYLRFRRTLKKHGLLPMCYKCCKLVYRYWSALPALGR